MPSRLDSFLIATDLDEVARLAIPRDELTKDEEARIRRTLNRRDKSVGRRNLLLQPEMIPGDLVGPELLAGLLDPDQPLVLASVAGSHRARADMDDTAHGAITARLIDLLSLVTSQLTRRRASAALLVLGSPEQAKDILRFLDDDDAVVRHNLRALLIRVLGAEQALALATDGYDRGAISGRALRFVEEGVDGGRATNHDMIMRGVLAPQLALIVEGDVTPTGGR